MGKIRRKRLWKVITKLNERRMNPKVTLVGAGPGDPDLITVKGLRTLQSADVVLYDALVNEQLLKGTKDGAQIIFVGKRSGKHSLTQPEINLLIVQSALRYGHVVRLKGGDPFVFGRGREEVEYVSSFNIPVEVIPGLSSSTSLCTVQGVPLTSRNYSESFWVLTGTTKSQELSRDMAIASGSNATLVILMGMRKIEQILDLLKANGRGNDPVMIIQSGTQMEEEVILGDIESIRYQTQNINLKKPGIIVAGKVVGLHPDFIMEKARTSWIKHQ